MRTAVFDGKPVGLYRYPQNSIRCDIKVNDLQEKSRVILDISTKVNTAYLEGVEKIFLCVILYLE